MTVDELSKLHGPVCSGSGLRARWDHVWCPECDETFPTDDLRGDGLVAWEFGVKHYGEVHGQ